MGLFSRRKTVFVDADILVIGGGMGGCGATYESRYWGRDLKIVCVEKANIERSGAVAQGLYAINCYMGMQWDENQPEDHVRYVRAPDTLEHLVLFLPGLWLFAVAVENRALIVVQAPQQVARTSPEHAANLIRQFR